MSAVDEILQSISQLKRKDLNALHRAIEKRLLSGGDGPEASGDRQSIDPQPPTLQGAASKETT